MRIDVIFAKLCLYLLSCTAMLQSCSDKPQGEPQGRTLQSKDTITTKIHSINFYKQFRGTIAGMPVTLHLTAYNGRYSGYCYYKGQSNHVTVISYDDTLAQGQIRLDELSITHRLPDNAFQPYWSIRLFSDSIHGQRISAPDQPTEEIILKESYPDGSYQMELIYHSLRAAYHNQSDTPYVTSTYYLLWPIGNDANTAHSFFSRQFADLAGCQNDITTTKYDLIRCLTAKDQDYFNEYRRIISESGIHQDELLRPTNNHYRDELWQIAGNENGLVTVEITSSEYTGGAHGNYAVTYHCLDVQEQKIWALPDIIDIDSSKLKVLLDIAARQYFDLTDSASLQERLLVNEIPLTGNMYITPTGIVFSYQPYEIASYADGVISLFISFHDLKGLLKDAFIRRINLSRVRSSHFI